MSLFLPALECFRHFPLRFAIDVEREAGTSPRGAVGAKLLASRALGRNRRYLQFTARECAALGLSVNRSRPLGPVALYNALVLLAYCRYQQGEPHDVWKEGMSTYTRHGGQTRRVLVPGPYTP